MMRNGNVVASRIATTDTVRVLSTQSSARPGSPQNRMVDEVTESYELNGGKPPTVHAVIQCERVGNLPASNSSHALLIDYTVAALLCQAVLAESTDSQTQH
jgi:hypothetical protein